MQNFNAIRPAVRKQFQKKLMGGRIDLPPPLHGRGLKTLDTTTLVLSPLLPEHYIQMLNHGVKLNQLTNA